MAQKTTSKAGGKGRTSKRSTKTTGSRRARSGPNQAGSNAVVDDEVSIDRRRSSERRARESAAAVETVEAAPPLERRKKVNRRRQIDPTTCERDYTDEEVEFMNALDDYKRRSGRMFPTCSEVLEVVRGLGYVKCAPADFEALRGTGAPASAKPMSGDWTDSPATDESVEPGVGAAAREAV